MKQRMLFLSLILSATGIVSLAHAQQVPGATAKSSLPDTPAAFGVSFRSWANKNQIRDAVIVVRRNGRLVTSDEIGTMKAADPQPVASMSKAITAVCATTLVRDGKLTFETPLKDALSQFFLRYGEPADPRIKAITIGQLISHQAGFPGRPDKGANAEVIGAKVLPAFLRDNPSTVPNIQRMLASTFKHPLGRDPGVVFEYGNASYLALSAVIEEKSGSSYESYCREAVLKPMGAAATLDPKWASLSGFGGWRISGENYLAFMDIMAPQNPLLGEAVKRWAYDDTMRPVRGAAGVWYGLGFNTRKAGNGYNVWHTGRWRINQTNAKGGALVDNFGSFAIRYANGVSVFIAHRPSMEDPVLVEMQKFVLEATQAVKNWN